MTPQEYIKCQMAIMDIGKRSSTLDLHGMIEMMNTAQTVAPIVDPTMYMKAQENLNALKKLAQKVLEVQCAFQETINAVISTAAKGHMAEENANVQRSSDLK